jgi:hypothetical protein
MLEIMGRVRLFHDVNVWDGRFNDLKKNSCPTNTFWSLYDHRQKIMSYNMVKTMV